jgi:hypothetical protein
MALWRIVVHVDGNIGITLVKRYAFVVDVLERMVAGRRDTSIRC